MALTVRQVGQVSPPLKQKIEQFQSAIDNNDQIVARIREQIRRMEPQRERLGASVRQRQDDGRNLHSSLARLEDALASFGAESGHLEATIEEIPRLLERISLPVSQPGVAAHGNFADGGMSPYAMRRLPGAAVDVPLPYFEALAAQLEERTQQIWSRVNAVEAALTTYSRPESGAPVPNQIEAVVRSQHAQFRALALHVAQTADRLEQLREAAIRTRGVPVGMLARPADSLSDQRRAELAAFNGGGQLGSLIGGPQAGSLLGIPQHGGAALGGGGLFGQPMGAMGGMGGGLFGQPSGGGLFGAQSSGGGLFGAQPMGGGGGLFGGASSGGGLFGANTGGGLFGAQSTGGGLFGAQTSGGGLFGANTGGGLFGAQTTGGGLFGANTGGGLFGANMGGGMFGANTGGGLFGANTGGGLFGGGMGMGMGGGAGLFGANMGGGLFGANPAANQMMQQGLMQQGLMQQAMVQQDPYGLGSLATANPMPPRPLGLILPRTPSRASSAYIWKSQPQSAATTRPHTARMPSRSTSEGSGADWTPRSGASFSLPPSATLASAGATPRSRPQTPPKVDGLSQSMPASLLRVDMSRSSVAPVLSGIERSSSASLTASRERLHSAGQDSLPPLRRPPEVSPLRSPCEDWAPGVDRAPETQPPHLEVKPIRPNLVRHAPETSPEEYDEYGPQAPRSLLPALSRPDYYCAPSIEAMSKMSEVRLSRIDNLEIGRYGVGSVKWPGLTDVRGLDFDAIVLIEQGSLTLYPDSEKPKIGEGLNKEAVISLNVKPSRADPSPKGVALLTARLTQISETFGGKFISYDLEKWIFRMPHFDEIGEEG